MVSSARFIRRRWPGGLLLAAPAQANNRGNHVKSRRIFDIEIGGQYGSE
jgi:hypothetical protein